MSSNYVYFNYINDVLDGIVQHGNGKTKAKPTVLDRYKSQLTTKYNMKHTIVRKFDRLHIDDIEDYTDIQFLIETIKMRAQRVGFHANLSTTLQLIGFTKKKSIDAEYAIEPFIGTSYTNSQLIDMCIEYIFGVLTSTIGDTLSTHYIEPTIVDTWFKDYINNVNRNIINTSYSANVENYEKLRNHINEMGISKKIRDQHDIFYHTTTWESALSILHKIDHTMGRNCLDFGVRPGFYIGTRMYDALEWGQKKHRHCNEIATVLFLLPKKIPSTLYYRKLEGEHWSNITKLSRKCIVPKFRRELVELEGLDLIYGDVVGNPEDIRTNDANPVRLHEKHQMAGKTENADRFLEKTIAGIIFYKKM